MGIPVVIHDMVLPNRSAWDRGSHRDITLLSGFDFEWQFGYVKKIYKTGTAFDYNKPPTQSYDNFQGTFGVVQPGFGAVS